MFVSGIDGGGTKTCVEIRTLDNKQMSRSTFGPLNINSTPIEEIEQTIYDIVQYIKSITGNVEDCIRICIGTAGISNALAGEILHRNFLENGCCNKLNIIGDHQIALYGALESNVGIGLISGTGSICFGTNNSGISHRVGGWGHILDDKGSGYDIGRRVLASVVQAYDGRLRQTVLQDLVFKQLNINSINQLVAFVHSTDTSKKELAAFAPLLDEGVLQKDQVSFTILDNICDELVKMVTTVVSVLDMSTSQLAMMGSILNHSFCISDLFKKKLADICPDIKPVTPKNDAAAGAAMLALQNVMEGK